MERQRKAQFLVRETVTLDLRGGECGHLGHALSGGSLIVEMKQNGSHLSHHGHPCSVSRHRCRLRVTEVTGDSILAASRKGVI
ncbi:hypothetical protein GCM10007160_21360 [Litchfieldella qijiaojingensis]|uniref:Uncharacterized protein n=1 Tax=Litchfieldella qijiaojingensis TaxID=980347 RepID=A0ABQ2YVH2_9GAMM|nr:hypothetical protein GCM10007160_21360 [Halomonas qijiaojingensis]